MHITENYPTVVDPCVYCGRSTAFGSGNGLFVNRIGVDDGWGCAECAGYECDECGEQIYLDCEIRVEYTDAEGEYHYGNYHDECYDIKKHGRAYGEENLFCDNCGAPQDDEDTYFYETSPWDVASANAGESVALCEACNEGLRAGKKWDELGY